MLHKTVLSSGGAESPRRVFTPISTHIWLLTQKHLISAFPNHHGFPQLVHRRAGSARVHHRSFARKRPDSSVFRFLTVRTVYAFFSVLSTRTRHRQQIFAFLSTHGYIRETAGQGTFSCGRQTDSYDGFCVKKHRSMPSRAKTRFVPRIPASFCMRCPA